MTEPLDDIAFLSRSINRVTVLEELSSYPQTRAGLEASTDVSKVTIGRILDDFLDRGWIVKTGDTYWTTPIGEVIATDFSQLRSTVETAQKLRSIAPYLSEIQFDVRCLDDATITVSDPSDPMAPFERPIDLLRGAERARFLSRMISPVVLEVVHEAVVKGALTVEAVLSESVLERIESDQEITTWTRDILDSPRAHAYLSEETTPFEAAMIDDVVAILVTDDDDIVRGFIETTDTTVQQWFDAEFEPHRESARPLYPADISSNDNTT
jgi:predicted transcriptional regulator